MKTISPVKFLLLSLWLAGKLLAETELLPGITYYEGSEPLTGKLAFLLQHNANYGLSLEPNSEIAASIYEFDLPQKKLHKVADTPDGLFIASHEGDAFCVIYLPDHRFEEEATNVFIYSDLLRQSRKLNLNGPPRKTVFLNGHVFFEVKIKNNIKLLDYDIARDKQRIVEFADASKWQYQDYKSLHAAGKTTNLLHFEYHAYGQRRGDGRDYRNGYYSLNISTDEIRWVSELDEEPFTFKAWDGHYIFFEGPNAPINGLKLVSSPWNQNSIDEHDPKRKQAKVLTTFSRLPTLRGPQYLLEQLSPCRHYALVSLPGSVPTGSEMFSGRVATYYVVDVSTGKTRVLLKDEVGRKSSGSLSHVWWVRGAAEVR